LAITRIRFANAATPTTQLASVRCIVDYEITDINQERSELFSSDGDTRYSNNKNTAYDYYIDPNDGTDSNQVLMGIWDHDSPGGPEKKGYFWIRAIVYANKVRVADNTVTPNLSALTHPVNQKARVDTGTIVLQQEVKMWVDIQDPCIRDIGATDSIVDPAAIPDMVYDVYSAGSAVTETVLAWRDKASNLYGYGAITITPGNNSQDNPWHVCGKKTYQIFRSDQVTEMDTAGSVYPYFTWTDSVWDPAAHPSSLVLQVHTTDVQYFTNANVVYWIRATLDDYLILYPTESTQWFSFNVNIENCIVDSYTFSDPTSSYQWDPVNNWILYNIYTPWQWIEMTDFVEVVSYNGVLG
jgi:hypothetical protein